MLPVWIVLIMLPLLGGAERFNCRGRILGAYYADAKSGCKAFHVCVRVAGGGVRDFRFFCPPGTLFHQEAQTCTDWGDDDPLACPADLYDGQFDLYKIGSGYDTKKLSAQGNRDEESEFGLQRAETGDRRSQNNGASDLRTAHSSDFFSGQRDRGRDEQSPPRPAPSASPTSHRQSFRRIPSSRPPPSPTTYFTTPSIQEPELPQYESHSKRKLVRKRPIYLSSTQPPTTFALSSSSQAEQQYNQQRSFPPQNQQQINQKQQQINHQQQKINHQQQQLNKQQNEINQQQQQKQQYSTSQQPFSQKQQPFPTQKQSFPKPPEQPYLEQSKQNFNQKVPQKATIITTLPPPTNLPPEYKDEYVEVSRVAPIKKNRYYINTPSTPSGFSQTSSPYFIKKDSLAELYNYNSQSTPALNAQNENKPFKIRNSFNVQDASREDFARINTNHQPSNGRGTPSTTDYNSATTTRASASTTPAYKNLNSISYESEKNNFVQYNKKQNYFSSPNTTPVTTTYYTTIRSSPPKRLNTVAYNTNNALNTQQSNFADNYEDDGQYRLPAGEDDGQYRPELYERELLSGAHSLNIAASGNRLPDDQKPSGKSQIHSKPTSQPPVPRPFKPAPTPSLPPVQTTKTAEPIYTTTFRAPTVSTERTFDQYKSYTTTSRPESSVPEVSFSLPVVSNVPSRPATTAVPRAPEPRPPSRAPPPPSAAPPRPTTRAPLPNKPVNNKEDSSYDYAYYDSDPGFTEYDHIEEFGRTKKRT